MKRGEQQRRESIDENLRRAFGEMADAPVPEKFLELLEKLRSEGGKAAGDEDKGD